MPRPFALIDWPPVWLALALALTWGLDRLVPFGLFGPAGRTVGQVLIAAGLLVMLAAAVQMVRARTTVVPRRKPEALVTAGLFGFTRNPIYLGDAAVLAGAILWLDVPLAVPVLLGFMGLIQARFILGEEAALRARFGPAFDAWAGRVRRWI